ncbi:unnamed protein product [Allacma fusca]|uniref:G-protein coupled receptors family 1 profile domain-containing protein n=1 Tax=Allacma fusca TaxID=39272 RepID=A0A8J2LEG5_9HEXA|nr:unnamed protein product [Allacma fusca]
MRLAYFGPVLLMSVLTTLMLIQVIRTAIISNSQYRNRYRIKKRDILTYTVLYGTFTVGLIPLAIIRLVFCGDCFISPEKVSVHTISWASMVTQSSLLLPMICNPVFYSWKNKQVQTGIWRMSVALVFFTFGCCMSHDMFTYLKSRRQITDRTSQRKALNSWITDPKSSNCR